MMSNDPPYETDRDHERPVFIVGPSRSGTSLAMRSLRAHPQIHITGETHYFDDLRTRLPVNGAGLLSADERRLCEDYFLAIADRGYGKDGRPDRSPMARAALRQAAAAFGGGSDAYFAAYCTLQASRHGKQRWGEKTPRHVYRIDDMLSCFPGAKVLCMVRDPRAVVLSYRDMASPERKRRTTPQDGPESARTRKRRSYDLIVMSLLWRSTVNQALAARLRHGPDRVKLLRYEDLVDDPRSALAEVARWLDVEFSERMLQVEVHNSTFVDRGEVTGVSSNSVARWRQGLSEDEISSIQILCRRPMRKFGYDATSAQVAPTRFVANMLRLPYTALRATVANRSRTGRLAPYVWRRVKTLVGTSG